MEQLPGDYLSSESELQINPDTNSYLIETSKWAKFIAIAFYVLTGVGSIILLWYINFISNRYGIYGSRIMDDYLKIAIIVVIIASIVVGVTYYFLLVFGNKMRSGLETENIEQVNAGLSALKVHFIIVGILLMLGILLALYNFSGYV